MSPRPFERTDPRSVQTLSPGKKLLIHTPLKASHTRSKSGLRFVALSGSGDSNDKNIEDVMSDDDDDIDLSKDKHYRKNTKKMNMEGGSSDDNSGDDGDESEDPRPRHSIQSRRRR